jgi:hypothetical protein
MKGARSAFSTFSATIEAPRLLLEAVEEDDELVAALARDGVLQADALGEAPRHLPQQLVADVVAERVVDVLEVVEVDEEHRDLALGALRVGDGMREAVLQQRAVRQPREVVVVGQVLDPLLDHLAVGDVARVEHHAADVRVGRQLVPSDSKVRHMPSRWRMRNSIGWLDWRRSTTRRKAERASSTSSRWIMSKTFWPTVSDGVVAHEVAQRRALVADGAVLVHDRDEVERAFREDAEARLAGLERALGLLVAGDVRDHADEPAIAPSWSTKLTLL